MLENHGLSWDVPMQLQARPWPLTEEGYQRLGSNAKRCLWRNVRQKFDNLQEK